MFETTPTMRMSMAIIAGAVLFVSARVQVARAEDGKAVYDKNCVACHGASGKGDGPAAKALKPPPGDFATTAKALIPFRYQDETKCGILAAWEDRGGPMWGW